MPGPPPTPTAIKVLHGNPGKRPLNREEPQPGDSMPATPAALRGDARAAWDALAGEMHRCGILTVIDGGALESYCRLYAAARECWAGVEATGGAVVEVDGKQQANPWFREANRVEAQLCKIRNELGLNATSRSRIRVGQVQQADDLEAFLKLTG